MEADIDLYLPTILERWKEEVSNLSSRVMIFSPYITSNVAETVIGGTSPDNCEVYTLLSIENFVTGSSSVATLRKLLEQGCKLYELPRLHTKIVLISPYFVSIGSQNLTKRSLSNLEATITTSTPEVVSFVEQRVKEWIKDRKAITSEVLSDVEELVADLVESYSRLTQEFESKERILREREQQREKERKEREEALERERQLRLIRLAEAIRRMNQARESVVGNVRDIKPNFLTFMPLPSIASNGSNLMRWRISGRLFYLEKSYRYLCLNADNGRLGWVRVGRTRITFIAQRVQVKGIFLKSLQKRCTVWFFAEDWKRELTCNLVILVLTRDNPSNNCLIRTWFGIDKLDVLDMDTMKKGDSREVVDLIRRSEQLFKEEIILRLLNPFKYTKNLFGVNVSEYFGDRDYELKLAEINGNPFLVTRQL